ncbi:MAG: CPBP family glutamic-type intramembrane protease [Terriglobales bacterium]
MAVPESRFWSIFQMVLLLVTMEGALWSEGATQVRWYLAALVVLAGCVLLSHPRADELGISLHGIRDTAWVIPFALVICAASVFAAAKLGTLSLLYGPKPVYWHSIFYAIWALEQQFILNSFFYNRFELLLGNTMSAVFTTALLFSLMHIPNPVLVPATFLGGLLFVESFRRWRNIYPLAIAHAMFGLTLAITFPTHWIRHMRVGLGFLRFHVQG